MANEETNCVGIDLGTTYSCLAFIDETGTPVVAKNKTGEPTTPSVVYFEEGLEHSESVVGSGQRKRRSSIPTGWCSFSSRGWARKAPSSRR